MLYEILRYFRIIRSYCLIKRLQRIVRFSKYLLLWYTVKFLEPRFFVRFHPITHDLIFDPFYLRREGFFWDAVCLSTFLLVSIRTSTYPRRWDCTFKSYIMRTPFSSQVIHYEGTLRDNEVLYFGDTLRSANSIL